MATRTEKGKEKRLHRNKELKLGKLKSHDKKKFTSKLKELLYPDKTFLINMEMRNGFHRQLTVIAKNQNFRLGKDTYIIDPKYKYYNIDQKLWCLDYHQDLALPLRRQIQANALKVKLQEDPEIEIEHAINPNTLHTFLTAKIAEGVMKGQAIDEFLRSMKMMVLVVMVVSIIHLILFAFKSGMLSQVGL